MSDNQYDQWRGKSGNVVETNPHNRLMGKLSKLLEVKQRAATEAEAATAATLLSRFLDEHNLSIADIEKRGQAAPPVTEGGHDLGKAAFKWKLDLAEGIARFFYVEALVNRQSKKVVFVGRPDNIEALTMLYGWVIDQVKSIATVERRAHFDKTGEHIDPLRWQLGFGEGAVQRLIVRLSEMKARQAEDATRNEMGDITALAIHHNDEANNYLEAKYGYRNDGKRTRKEQDSIDRWNKSREEQASLKAICEANGDMEPYYAAYPWDIPDTPEQIAARNKRNAEYEKREARNARRRTGSGGRSGPAIDERKEEQAYTARVSGRSAADRVNLQPFIGQGKQKGSIG